MALTRRGLLLAPAALAVPLAAPSIARAEELERMVVIRTTGGVFEAALKRNFFEPFTKATGVRVVPVAASDGEMMAKSTAMQASGRVEWDIISPQYDDLANHPDLLADLGDCSAMPHVASDGVAQACNRYGVLYVTGGQVLAWDPRAFQGGAPADWADFWDIERFPGRRALPNTGNPWASIVSALSADGVPASKLFPLDMDRAFRKLDAIKPHIDLWWRTGDQCQAMMRSGDIQVGLMWSGRAVATKREGVPLDWTYNQAVADFGAWAILKGAPHPNAARAFIDFYMTRPEAHAAFSREAGYMTPNRFAADLLAPDEKRQLVATPATYAGIIHMDPTWLAANRAAGIERWNSWISA